MFTFTVGIAKPVEKPGREAYAIGFSTLSAAMDHGKEIVDNGKYWVVVIQEGTRYIMYYHRAIKHWKTCEEDGD